MSAITYSRLAALIFAIVAVLQLARAVSGWPVIIGTTFSVPVWAKLDCLRCCRWACLARFERLAVRHGQPC
jgi:hypothetical protein